MVGVRRLKCGVWQWRPKEEIVTQSYTLHLGLANSPPSFLLCAFRQEVTQEGYTGTPFGGSEKVYLFFKWDFYSSFGGEIKLLIRWSNPREHLQVHFDDFNAPYYLYRAQ